jgi:hypothetical protein
MKLDVPKRWFTPPNFSGHRYQTPTGGRKLFGLLGTVFNFGAPVQLPSYTYATVPSAVTSGEGTMIYVTDGLAGAPTMAISDGTNWKTASSNANISDS